MVNKMVQKANRNDDSKNTETATWLVLFEKITILSSWNSLSSGTLQMGSDFECLRLKKIAQLKVLWP